MRRAGTIIGLVLILAAPAGAAPGIPGPGSPGTLRVDASGGSKGCGNARFTRIQDAIDAATKPMTMIEVCPGTYREQLVITKRIKLKGKGNPPAIIMPTAMVANTTSARTGAPVAAGIVAAAQTMIENLEIDLSQNGLTDCSGPLLAGVYFRGVSGSIKKSRIHGARLGVPCESGAAVLIQGSGSTPTRVDVQQSIVSDYQRGGIVVNERGVRANIQKNTVTGLGETADVPQNGIQVGFGAAATVAENVVQNNATPSGSDCTFDAGNLVFMSSGGVVQNNTFTGNTSGVIINGSSNRIIHNTIDGLSGGTPEGLDGISVFGDRNNLSNNTIRNVSEVGIRLVGNNNASIHNAISGTHEAALCTAARALPGCSAVLTTCGVGLWVAGGTSNIVDNSMLSNNDVNFRDDGSSTVVHGPLPH